jgi:simple sugar transport system permease protein
MDLLLNHLSTIIHNTVVYSTPLIFAALGGIFSERSGVTNIGLEGIMVMGAFSSAITVLATGSPWLGLLVAIVVGGLISLPHAVASIRFRSDQVVSGLATNFLALGLAVYLTKRMFHGSGQTDTIESILRKWDIPWLSEIPYLGKMFFSAYPTSYLAIVLAFVSWYVLFKTPFGLRLRAVGEKPAAADTLGIRVNRMRYGGVILSGLLSGLGGAVVTLTTTGLFGPATISGQGFIALAAIIFGKYHPIGAMGAALFFGFAQGLSSSAQVLGFSNYVPIDFIQMLPYVLTILILAGFVGKVKPPAANGIPYVKGER